MFRQWMCISLLTLMGVPLWAQDQRAIKRDHVEKTAQRVALVIGNGAYTGSITPLRNPVNDARGMKWALENIGFEVIIAENADRSQIGEKIHEFSQRIGNEGIALFYFSGHGLQVDGINYLVPIDEKIEEEYQIKHRCNSANEILDMMETRRGKRINIVILDACRNNPLPIRTKSIGNQGLASMPVSTGSLIAYAAAAGKTAIDGAGNHSPYTESLIRHIQTPGLDIEDVFKAVGRDVLKATNGKQSPARYSNLNHDYHLVPSSINLDMQPSPPSLLLSRPPIQPPSKSIRYMIEKLPDSDVEIEFVWISPGTFRMGSPSTEDGWKEHEGPMHQVEISRGFYLGKYEVTQEQWETVMGTRPWVAQSVRSEPNNPAVYVSWEDAQTFVNALNDSAGAQVYRLPTEAEWEYACRAGRSTPWSFGDDENLLRYYAWYEENACDVGDCYAQAVGTKQANPWGLHDMHGNVGEWILDGARVYNRASLVDPTGPSTGSQRVMRGGYFGNYTQFLRSASRRYLSPEIRANSIGFRILRRAD